MGYLAKRRKNNSFTGRYIAFQGVGLMAIIDKIMSLRYISVVFCGILSCDISVQYITVPQYKEAVLILPSR